MWCLGKKWKVPVLNLQSYHPPFPSHCGCLENTSVFSVAQHCWGALWAWCAKEHEPFLQFLLPWSGLEGTLLSGFGFLVFFSFFIMSVSARCNLCVLILRSLNTLSVGDANIWYKWLGQTSLCLYSTSALVTSVSRSYCVVSHSCWLVLAQQKAEGSHVEVVNDRALQKLGGLMYVRHFATVTFSFCNPMKLYCLNFHEACEVWEAITLLHSVSDRGIDITLELELGVGGWCSVFRLTVFDQNSKSIWNKLFIMWAILFFLPHVPRHLVALGV